MRETEVPTGRPFHCRQVLAVCQALAHSLVCSLQHPFEEEILAPLSVRRETEAGWETDLPKVTQPEAAELGPQGSFQALLLPNASAAP